MSNKLEDLDPAIYVKAKNAFNAMNESKKLKEYGVEKVIISETKRELTTQMAYYSRGRMDVEDVKKMYKAAGLYDISGVEACNKVTWTLQSNHLKGRAIDFVPVKNGSCWWQAVPEVWEEIGRIGESYGFTWGGRWEQKDLPHFEITD